MNPENIIVIGASAGGFEALKVLVRGLREDLPAAILIVWHMSADVRGVLPQVLNRYGPLYAAHALDGEEIVHGRIYVAPPDRHLIVDSSRVRITRGPKENRFRPAVDPLFRSAALHYGPKVTGVILSGALDDGSSGLWTVKHYGGSAIVQDPREAEVPSMPENAIRAVPVDHIVPVSKMPALFDEIIRDNAQTGEPAGSGLAVNGDEGRLNFEVGVALEQNPLESWIMDFGELSPYSCPECHGVLASLKEGNRVRFRCHTGHAYTADSLLATVTENIEKSLWDAIRGVDESIILLNHMGDHFAENNETRLAALFFRKANEAKGRSELVRSAVVINEQMSTDGLRSESESFTDGQLDEGAPEQLDN